MPPAGHMTFDVIIETPRSVRAKWEAPAEPNGNLTYTVLFTGPGKSNRPLGSRSCVLPRLFALTPAVFLCLFTNKNAERSVNRGMPRLPVNERKWIVVCLYFAQSGCRALSRVERAAGRHPRLSLAPLHGMRADRFVKKRIVKKNSHSLATWSPLEFSLYWLKGKWDNETAKKRNFPLGNILYTST